MKIKLLTVLSLTVVLLLGACGGGKSDTELQADADKALKADPATSAVTVAVSDGVATVSGEVADEAAKAKAAELANVEGVKSVTNNVTVKAAPPPPAPSADDSTIKSKIEEGWKAKKGCEGATVEVKDGVATLRGSVPSASFGECVMVANQAGAKKIENEIAKK